VPRFYAYAARAGASRQSQKKQIEELKSQLKAFENALTASYEQKDAYEREVLQRSAEVHRLFASRFLARFIAPIR
jgi:hypothetical protein